MANPKPGEVYNMGGRELSCSIREAIASLEEFSDKKLKWTYAAGARTGDHRWYISNTIKFRNHYGWKPLKTLKDIYLELIEKA